MTFEAFPSPIRERLIELHAAADFRGVISYEQAAKLVPSGRDQRGLPALLLPAAAQFSRPPVSGFRVGAVATASSGSLYYGANLEFPGESLLHTVHAEQSAVINAWMAGERGVEELAVTAAPCGYCRQFLNELTTADHLVIHLPAGRRALQDLLPDSFGPRDLVTVSGLMHPHDQALSAEATDRLAGEALAAARLSYAPYSRAFAGVALQTAEGRIVRGTYAENAAFNPSLPPLAAALSQLNLSGGALESIVDAVLVTTAPIHATVTRSLLAAVSRAELRVVEARNSDSSPDL